jgi:NADPH2:quinone reductase
MRAIGLHEYGGPDVLQVVEVPTPHAGHGEIRIRVHAVTVNPADTLVRLGDVAAYLQDVPPPYIPGMDAAGVVDEIGEGAETDLQVGDAVMAMVMPIRPEGGAYAEQLVLPATWVVRAPRGTGHAEASTLPMNGLTARQALDLLALSPGDTLAVTGAAGCLGGYVIGLARAAGLRVLAVAVADDEALVRELGAELFVPRGDDFAAGVRAAVPGGVDGLVDAALIGPPALAAIRDGGGIATVRQPGERGVKEIEPERGITVHPVQVLQYGGDTARLDSVREHAEQGTLRPRIAARHTPEEAGDAHRALEAGGSRGRHVIVF